MVRCLLSIDWDYFINVRGEKSSGSYLENNRNIIALWYKRYIQSKMQGRDLQKTFQLASRVDMFWGKMKEHFRFTEGLRAYVSDSHALSYRIARNQGCDSIYLFDAHADLGYGGISSLSFEVNCANWLGKLLKERRIKKADIIYSPYTTEKPENFKAVNHLFHVRYPNLDDLDSGIEISAIHICRSGAWTPPWLDKKFVQFVKAAGVPYEIIDCPKRNWDPANISLSDQIFYMMA